MLLTGPSQLVPPSGSKRRRLTTEGQGKHEITMLLEILGLGRTAGQLKLLDNVSFSVREGQRLSVLGPSGSGKTLLLRSLALLAPIDAGEIRWRGQRVHGAVIPHYRSRMVYLHQRPALMEGSVEHNLRLPFSLRVHRDKRFERARTLALLDALGRTEGFLSKQQGDLSGGEAQLTALLRAMQLDPDLLLLDEPTAALDPAATEMVERLVSSWCGQQAGRGTIWVTHDQEQARRVSTSVLHIRDGRLHGEV